MAETLNYQDLARRYGFAAVSDSVTRLTQLVAKQEAPLDMIAKVIAQDKSLTARLLRSANPRADCEEDYVATTVEEALARTGLGCVLLLAMSAPLTFALIKTFDTMLGLKLESRNVRETLPPHGAHLCCKIGFSGKAEGEVFLRMSLESARLIGTRVLGLGEDENFSAEEINDAIGELLNIATGNFKSNLCDAGLDCRLSTPSLTRNSEFTVRTVVGGGLDRMAFQVGDILVFVDVTVNPWRDG